MLQMKPIVLIIDENEINRKVLKEILTDEYVVLEAEAVQTAINLLSKNDILISAILLDVQTPSNDKYGLLSSLNTKEAIRRIPIIITTNFNDTETEVKCLDKGAFDFITRPFLPNVVHARIKNAIRLYDSIATLSAVEHDDLTGLYTKGAFFKHIETVLKRKLDTRYDLIIAGILNFDGLKDKYGEEKATALLRLIGKRILFRQSDKFISAHFGPGIFVALAEVKEDAIGGKERIQNFREYIASNSPIPNVDIKYVLYENVDHSIPAHMIYKRGLSVLERIIGQYGVTIGIYSPEIQKELDLISMIESDMVNALEEKQFEVFYQPKFYIGGKKDYISGAEALIRWIHPKCGFMKPGMFIPLFEKNGFISRLDLYVLDRVCADLKEWRKKDIPLVSISVNLSRVDFSDNDLVQAVTSIVDAYQIPHELIHFEITESAFSTQDDLVKQKVHALHESGFLIELDDFGSGYSSLASLQSLDMDIVKLDKSLIREDKPNSGRSILNFAHRLIHMTKLKTVQEGVETKEELERVRALKCDYVQGYYFSKPLSKEEFAIFCQKNAKAPAKNKKRK